MLGKIENNMARSEIDLFRLMKISSKVADYISNTATNWIHPTFKSKEEKKMAYKKKKSPGKGGGKKRY